MIYFCQEKLLPGFEIFLKKFLSVLSKASSGFSFVHVFEPMYESLSCRKVNANESEWIV